MDRRTVLAGAGSFVVGGGLGWGIRGLTAEDAAVAASCDCPDPGTRQQYPAELVEVIDADTLDLLVDVGLNTDRGIRVRIAPIDTAEFDENEQLAREQTQFVEALLRDADRLVFRSEGEKGGFGRWLGDVNADGVWLSEAVLERWPDATYDG